MPSNSMTYKVRGIEELDSTLQRAVRRMSDWKQPLKESGVYMYQSIDKNFQSGGRPSKWKGHHWLTKKLRGGGQVLSDTGRLRQSVTSKGAGSKYQLSDSKLVIGSNVKARGSSRLLADIQQNGVPAGVNKVFGKPGKGGIPARPFLLIQSEDEERIEEIFRDYIEGVFR
ncbi:phage virion morphogenesis protein [Priestia endophytica]|uniref:phage virion morphogenesis protein n=1 Tax=Priestia endophytica TaxID=135735 RepID=UPI003D26B0E9